MVGTVSASVNMILDEPTEAVRPIIVAEIALLMRSLNDELGLRVLLVEQRLSCARKVGEDVFCHRPWTVCGQG